MTLHLPTTPDSSFFGSSAEGAMTTRFVTSSAEGPVKCGVVPPWNFFWVAANDTRGYPKQYHPFHASDFIRYIP